VACIARDVGSSSTNRSSDIMHFLPRLLKKTLQHERLYKQNCHVFPVQTLSKYNYQVFHTPSSTRNPGIIPSDDPGEALSVSSKDIHLSKHAKVSGIHCTM